MAGTKFATKISHTYSPTIQHIHNDVRSYVNTSTQRTFYSEIYTYLLLHSKTVTKVTFALIKYKALHVKCLEVWFVHSNTHITHTQMLREDYAFDTHTHTYRHSVTRQTFTEKTTLMAMDIFNYDEHAHAFICTCRELSP